MKIDLISLVTQSVLDIAMRIQVNNPEMSWRDCAVSARDSIINQLDGESKIFAEAIKLATQKVW